jgi:hypothetical protein
VVLRRSSDEAVEIAAAERRERVDREQAHRRALMREAAELVADEPEVFGEVVAATFCDGQVVVVDDAGADLLQPGPGGRGAIEAAHRETCFVDRQTEDTGPQVTRVHHGHF